MPQSFGARVHNIIVYPGPGRRTQVSIKTRVRRGTGAPGPNFGYQLVPILYSIFKNGAPRAQQISTQLVPENILRSSLSRGETVVISPSLYFQYYLDKMDAGPGRPGPKRYGPSGSGPRKYRWTQQDWPSGPQIKAQEIDTYVWVLGPIILKVLSVNIGANFETRQIEYSYVSVNKVKSLKE